MVADSSICRKMRLLAVTAEVLMVSVGLTPVGTATTPAAAEVQTAGEAAFEQLTVVLYVAAVAPARRNEGLAPLAGISVRPVMPPPDTPTVSCSAGVPLPPV